jgi:ribosomal-protein-alanine N-acetyltransferase
MSIDLAELRWFHIEELLPIEDELFGEERWSAGMFWNELANGHHYLVAVDRGTEPSSPDARPSPPRGPSPVTGPPSGSTLESRSAAIGSVDGGSVDSGSVDGVSGPAVGEHGAEPGAGGRRGRIVGYAGLAVSPPDEAWVQNIGVRGDAQRRGIGRRLLEALLDEAARRGARQVLLEVAVDNAPAQKLYAQYGFEAVGIRRGYYQPSNTDALVMMREQQD